MYTVKFSKAVDHTSEAAWMIANQVLIEYLLKQTEELRPPAQGVLNPELSTKAALAKVRSVYQMPVQASLRPPTR